MPVALFNCHIANNPLSPSKVCILQSVFFPNPNLSSDNYSNVALMYSAAQLTSRYFFTALFCPCPGQRFLGFFTEHGQCLVLFKYQLNLKTHSLQIYSFCGFQSVVTSHFTVASYCMMAMLMHPLRHLQFSLRLKNGNTT